MNFQMYIAQHLIIIINFKIAQLFCLYFFFLIFFPRCCIEKRVFSMKFLFFFFNFVSCKCFWVQCSGSPISRVHFGLAIDISFQKWEKKLGFFISFQVFLLFCCLWFDSSILCPKSTIHVPSTTLIFYSVVL